jgi:hypothetical protein
MSLKVNCQLSGLQLKQFSKVPVPDLLHFVWVGDTNLICTDYIDLWEKTNQDKEVFFWCDLDISQCHHFHNSIKKFLIKCGVENHYEAERHIRNEAFNYIFPKLIGGGCFNDCVNAFFMAKGIEIDPVPASFLNPWFEGKRIKVKNLNTLFNASNEDFRRFYYYEIILRGNLASASDIVRLMIIYSFGGTYIDVDTLPGTDHLFGRLNVLFKHSNVVEDDYLRIFKTKKILNKLYQFECSNDEYIESYKYGECFDLEWHEKILKAIASDVSDFTLDDIPPLEGILVYEDLLAIGAVKELKGVYFNNFISSHRDSRTVRIILRTMKKRYCYLEENDCIFNFHNFRENTHYLSRILAWRSELINRNYDVTSVLTGPGLIVEVLIGLAYELLDLDDTISPNLIADYMHDVELGIALFHHNLYTPEGMKSSWRS